MATTNDITGDSISSKTLSEQGRDNWDNIFGKKKTIKEPTAEDLSEIDIDVFDIAYMVTRRVSVTVPADFLGGSYVIYDNKETIRDTSFDNAVRRFLWAKSKK